LHALCQSGLLIGRPTLTYVAAGQGLTQEGPLQHRFLLARGQTLLGSQGLQAHTRARQCLRAARELASRARDLDAVREASQGLEGLPQWDLLGSLLTGAPNPLSAEAAPTSEEIAVTIDAERRSPRAPRFSTMKPPRPSRPKKPRRHRAAYGMIEEMISFLDLGGKW
jgi:hypothetical protein